MILFINSALYDRKVQDVKVYYMLIKHEVFYSCFKIFM